MASATRRFGVAAVVDPPLAGELDGVRRALGDPSFGRIPPHLTLVPPVNVRAEGVGPALALLRHAARDQPGPLALTVGAIATFLPDNPVVYLQVGGDLDRLRRLRDAVFVPPLARPLTWPWVPHVTLADGIDEDRVEAAAKVLDRFEHIWTVDRVVMLQERPGRIWAPVADVGLGAVAIVGTGGLPLEISQGRIADPEVRRMLSAAEVDWPDGEGGDRARTGSSFFPILMSARRDRELVGMAAGWTRVDAAHVGVFVAPDQRRQGIGTHLLAHLEAAARRAGWPYPVLQAEGSEGFYEARSGWARTAATRTRPRSTAPAS